MSKSGVDTIVSDYFARLRRALAPLPRSRRNQLLEDLREHVIMARSGLGEETELSVREILDHLGTPEDIAAEALAAAPRTPGRGRRLQAGRWRPRPGRLTRRKALVVATAVAVLAAGGTFAAISASGGPLPASAKTDAAVVPDANSDCVPQTDAATSGGPVSTLTGKATEVAHGTVAGHAWSLWSARGQSGANGLENGGLVLDGRAYGLCPGFPNPAELELADVGTGIVYGVIGYPGLAKVDLYKSTAGTFDRGSRLPSPSVTVVRGVSFFIGELPGSACDYPSLELNSTSPGVSAEHNLGFGSCTAGRLVPITASQGIWQLPPGHFPSGFPGPSGGGGSTVPVANSTCSPQTNPATSGGPAAALTSNATEVAHGTAAGHAWSLWSARGQSGANGMENGGLVVDGRAYGLCPGFPNPAELELADIGPAPGTAIVYGVIGYHGLAKVDLYQSTAGTFDRGARLPDPSVTVVQGVSFFIGTLPKSACDYPSLELNSTSPGVSAEHNLGFGHCTVGRLVPITASQGIWQLKPGQFPSGFGGPGGAGPGGAGPGGGGAGGGPTGPPGFPAIDSNCSPQTNAATSGGPAATLTSKATEVAHGTAAGHRWSLWSARGQSGANGLEDGGLVLDGRAFGLCPGFPNPAELEVADVGTGVVYGVIGYPGLAKVHLYASTTGTFDTGQPLPAPSVIVVHGVSFFIGTLPKSACAYPSLELNAAAKQGSSQHNLGFGKCVTGKLVPITASQGIWSVGR
jgi:hypothetical protein